jgi:hypothetical protein
MAIFNLSVRSLLPPDISAKDLSAIWTQVLNAHLTKIIHCHPAQSDENSVPETCSETKNLHNSSCDFDHRNELNDVQGAEHEIDIGLHSGSRYPERSERLYDSVTPNDTRVILTIWRSTKMAELRLIIVSAM